MHFPNPASLFDHTILTLFWQNGKAHHAFVLCSDGLTDVAQSDRLAQATATCRTSSSPLLAKRRRNEGSVGAEKKRTVPAGPVGGSGYSPKQHTPTGSLNAKRRNSSLGPVVSSGTPKGSDNLISGVECADDNYWGSRRVAQVRPWAFPKSRHTVCLYKADTFRVTIAVAHHAGAHATQRG